MKFIIPKFKLENLILIADTIVESRVSSIIFSNIVIEAFANRLFISASDSVISFKGNEEAEVKEEGKVLVNSKMFSDIIKVLPDDDIEISLFNNELLKIKPVNKETSLKFELKTIISDEYNLNIEFEESQLFSVNFNLFKKMSEKVSFLASDVDKYYSLNGILVEKKDDKIAFVATDKKRLAYSYQFDFDPEIKAIIPNKFFNILNKINIANDNIMFGIFPKKVILLADNILIQSFLLEPNFPEYKRIILSNCYYNVKLDLEELKKKLKMLSPLISSLDDTVIFDFNKDSLHLVYKSNEAGNVENFMSCEFRQEPITLYISYKNLNDILKVVDSEFILLEFNQNPKTIMLKPFNQDENYNLLYVFVVVNK
ncbi:MAG: DNA polymerase III subunit beta [Spirochaetes bacterium]|nr:DNA polymerase III subunit beta [Spirochaetota bacterium]